MGEPAAIRRQPRERPTGAALINRVDTLHTAIAAVTDQLSDLGDRVDELGALVRHRTAQAEDADARGPSLDEIRAVQVETTAEITSSLVASERAVRHAEKITSALAIELAEVGQQLGNSLEASSQAVRAELLAGLGELGTDIEGVGESVADSLSEVSERLDTLIAREPERPLDTEAMGRIEMLVEALVEAGEAPPTDAESRSALTLERLGDALSERVEAATTASIDRIATAVRAATRELKGAVPPVVDRSTTAALTRLEDRVAELTRQREDHNQRNEASIHGVEEMVDRLAHAQAEDLERILDSIEAGSADPERAHAHIDRLGRIEAAVAALADQMEELSTARPPAPEDAEAGGANDELKAIRQQISVLNGHMEVLRRRVTLRARATPALDAQAVRAVAETVVALLEARGAPGAAPPPRPVKARSAAPRRGPPQG